VSELRSQHNYHFVLDADDRITYVRDWPDDHGMSPFVGRVLWERLPGAEQILREKLEEARHTGRESEFAVFYAGRTHSVRVVPAADGLGVHVEQMTKLDVRTLSTLAASLRQIESELAAREFGRRDPPAP